MARRQLTRVTGRRARRALGTVASLLLVLSCASGTATTPRATVATTATTATTPAPKRTATPKPATGAEAPAVASSPAAAASPVGLYKQWDVDVPAGTKLEALKNRLEAERALLPPGDLQDKTPIPAWFRVYMRKSFPDLPTTGPYQYPRTATRLFQRVLDHPNDPPEPPPSSTR